MEAVAFATDAHENLLRAIEPPSNSPRAIGVYHSFYNAALARAQRRALGLAGAPTLLEALCTRRSADATDPRDKVYSLLGVARDRSVGVPELPSGPDVAVDYSRSVARIYRDCARHIVKTTLSLDILCACQNPGDGRAAGGIPSWVPDWSTRRTNGPVQNPDQWGHIHFASRPVAAVAYMEPPDEDTLVVSGVYVDTVAGVGDEHTYGCEWEALKENWKGLAVSCAWTFDHSSAGSAEGAAGPCYMTGESIPVAFFKTLTMGRIGDDAGHEPEDLMRVEIARIKAIERRRFFVTQAGFMALGPAETQVGDKVVVIHGAHVPFVLRKDVDGGGGHAVVGEVYVHGLMNGEALDEDMRDGFLAMLGRRPSVEKFLR